MINAKQTRIPYTIDKLPIVDSMRIHFFKQEPLNNELIIEVQDTDYFMEIKIVQQNNWKKKENKLAYLMKYNGSAFLVYKKEVIKKYGQEVVENAGKYLQCLLSKRNVPTVLLHLAIISWFVHQIIDVEQTIKKNGWII